MSYENHIHSTIIKPLNIPENELGFEIGTNQHAKGYHKNFSLSNAVLGLLIDKSKFMDAPEHQWKPFKDYYVKYQKKMFTENITNGNTPTGMCLSWFTGRLKGKQFYTHAGGGGGYYCEIRIYPEAGVGSVIMFNHTGMRDERFLDNPDLYFLESY